MAKCAGCSSGIANVTSDNTNCIHLTGEGTESSPLVATLQIDPASPAAITCGVAGLSVAGGSGGGGPFLIVASSTTAPDRQAIANYVCDGVADDVEINQAVTDLTIGNGGGWGGTVYLLEGEYNTVAPIDLNFAVNLQGAGYTSTYIYFDGNGDAGPRIGVGNPYGDDYVIVNPGEGGVISDLYINQFDSSGTGFRGGIRLDGERSLAIRVKIELDSDPLNQPIQNSAIRLNAPQATVMNSWIEAWDGTAVDGGSDQDYMRVQDNYIGASIGIDCNGTDEVHISGNWMFGGAEIGATIYDYDDPQFDFVFGNGIAIWAGPDEPSIVANNRIEGFARAGIVVDQASNVSVLNNTVNECSRLVPNTWSGIWIREGNYGINVQGNMVRGDHKYGLEIGTNSFNTLATNNDLLDSGVTGAFFDGGIDTVTLGGNRIA